MFLIKRDDGLALSYADCSGWTFSFFYPHIFRTQAEALYTLNTLRQTDDIASFDDLAIEELKVVSSVRVSLLPD